MRDIPIESKIWFHVYNRGVSKQSIFYETIDNQRFIRRLYLSKQKFSIKCLAYCLMPNHFHLIIKSNDSEPKISFFMHSLQMSYSKYFNLKYNRTGALFQGTYKAKPIENEKYLLLLMHYIHSNPVKDGFINEASDWQFSSLKAWQDQNSQIIDFDNFPLEQNYADFYRDDKDWYQEYSCLNT